MQVRDVTFTYAADLPPVIAGLDLVAGSATSRGLTVITGPSGIGKTTLLDLIAGLRLPTAGRLTAPGSHYVTQRPFLPAGSIRAALTIGGPATDEHLWAALRQVGLDEVVAGLPDGLGSSLGDDGFGLSAGQRQRLGLARAWLAPESLLLVDEPTAHLDGTAAESARDLTVALAAERTVIAVTHDSALVLRADHHVHLTQPLDATEVVDAGPEDILDDVDLAEVSG